VCCDCVLLVQVINDPRRTTPCCATLRSRRVRNTQGLIVTVVCNKIIYKCNFRCVACTDSSAQPKVRSPESAEDLPNGLSSKW